MGPFLLKTFNCRIQREKTCTKSVINESSLGIVYFAFSSIKIIEARTLSQGNFVIHWKVVTVLVLGASTLRL